MNKQQRIVICSGAEEKVGKMKMFSSWKWFMLFYIDAIGELFSSGSFSATLSCLLVLLGSFYGKL